MIQKLLAYCIVIMMERIDPFRFGCIVKHSRSSSSLSHFSTLHLLFSQMNWQHLLLEHKDWAKTFINIALCKPKYKNLNRYEISHLTKMQSQKTEWVRIEMRRNLRNQCRENESESKKREFNWKSKNLFALKSTINVDHKITFFLLLFGFSTLCVNVLLSISPSFAFAHCVEF